jgi:hypothetical protein
MGSRPHQRHNKEDGSLEDPKVNHKCNVKNQGLKDEKGQLSVQYEKKNF